MDKLKELQKKIPCQWRVQSFSKNKPQGQCVAYIDARDVMNLLDDVVGAENWQDDYKLIDGKLLAGIGILCNDKWVWKWDTGTESNMEAEKGQMSDAFKRAGVKWGIGRFLYDYPIQYVTANEVKGERNFPYPVNEQGQRIWDLTAYINSKLNK
jgi:hypothetical protein